MVALVVISPMITTNPLVVHVSHAIRALGSWARIASTMASDI
jgi:hypothetical protein